MRQTEGELLTLRWAKALKNVAEKITVYITPDQLLAGRVGQLGRYGILYPEIDGDFYIEVMKDLPNREKSPFQIDPTDMQILMEEIAPYWEGKTYHEHLNKVLPAEIRGVTYHDERGLKSKFVVSETSSYRSALQWVPDYEKAMKRGFIDIQNEAKAKLADLDLTNSVDIWEKKPFLEAMIIVCDAIMIWAKRHAQLARDTAAVRSGPQAGTAPHGRHLRACARLSGPQLPRSRPVPVVRADVLAHRTEGQRHHFQRPHGPVPLSLLQEGY